MRRTARKKPATSRVPTAGREARAYVKSRLVSYTYPRIWIVDPLPKGRTGKILKRENVLLAAVSGK
jgi:acyl-coenzyme A synthetase/AMP-(fatty) acid ligase